jgi:peptidoglycan-associated lipoprotein
MKTANVLKMSCVALGLLSLAACSSMGHGANGNNLSTTALGSQYGVQPMGVGNDILLAAPHNQSYYYDYNVSMLKPQYVASVQAQANYMASHPSATILVAGNTDARGSHEYNMALGERRALSVVTLLKQSGVKASQIRYISYGDMRPIALGNSDTAFAQNRRVDLTYKSK